MSKPLSLMIQGTHSDAGKSVITTAFCRIFAQDGHRTAPFKSQNMALNSYVTIDGKEIGRAQGVQAEAAGVEATTDMNPILIKPSRENDAQIVVLGKPFQNMNAFDYRKSFYEMGRRLIKGSLATLYEQYDCVVIEGAGSPAEVNLNDREIVNMSVARMANAPVILVGDIEKGGVFASLVGTLQLLEEEDRERIIGVIINKFRGDISLLKSGLDWFEEYSGKRVLGVIPYLPGLNIEAEDSVVLQRYSTRRDETKGLDIAVIQYPMISNFTDIDPFFAEEDCSIRFVTTASQLGQPDLIILPGSKNTIEDLLFLKATGLFEKLQKSEAVIVGICGGYQMLGVSVSDPEAVETPHETEAGLGLLPVETVMDIEKTTVRSQGIATFRGKEFVIKGYEIHMGRSSSSERIPFMETGHGLPDGAKSEDERIIGTYFHGLFYNDEFRSALLNSIRKVKQQEEQTEIIRYNDLKEKSFVTLADHVRKHVDLAAIYKEMERYSERRMPV
ncbi:adenosylcobyric acid synthase (glutamine-hydrolysing) [Fictibacillus enclensis]|uniref:Cobyric acid synthase n=1 Tax=Fictibacillus enclensis TaxID=1017270 RepID=A0A0V8JBD9_9BACL|nr:cobyric acid synthase [Fictibacillus enclensis]KSU84502.1 cobalamin biosynthesis protein CobQ [Fictibacillus enclensis]SCB80567.1 adenosylcobyric acid synthase (glutamine-hydrolysing) [Fictibacillus enclensis]